MKGFMIYETPSLETDRLILKRGSLSDYEKVYVKKEMTLDDWEEHSKVAKRVPRTLEEVKPIADKFDKMLDNRG